MAVFVVRGGSNGEVEDLCLREGYCGIGWDGLGDLSLLGSDGIDREVDVVYPDAAGPAQWKSAIKDFMSIAPGDLVLMPLKTRRGYVAVGEVVGEYEHRADFPRLARNVKRTRWMRDDVPRESIGDLLRWMDRPPTVSRVPVEDAASRVKAMLDSGQPIKLDAPAGPGALSAILASVLAQLASAAPDMTVIKPLVTQEAPAAARALIGDGWSFNSGVGIGTVADVPWFGIYPAGGTTSAQRGFYLVYLFAADGSAVYLSLNQGTENVKGGRKPLLKRAVDLRTAAGLPSAGEPIDLRSPNARPRKYQAANAYALRYAVDALPDDAVLATDLAQMLGSLTAAIDTGLSFDPEIEPLHLLFKWSADIEAQILELQRAVVTAYGSAWWGKYGDTDTPMSERRVEQLNLQLERGIPTYVFLYGGGQLVRSRLRQLAFDPGDVDTERLAEPFTTDDFSMFVRVSDFVDLEPAWPLDHLLLASDPVPSTVPGALGNQTTPLYVYERFVLADAPQATAAQAAKPRLTRDWLAQRTLWTPEQLDELLDALDERGQVILSGPPGTGKTWVAEHVARYLAQEQPLQIRTVQFHPSYGYEEFVEGLRPVVEDGAVTFKRQDGVILQLANEMEGTDATRILIIDELNRANVPRVFGELLYLLEYRQKPIRLQYSKSFELPENLKIIATMNTADRSIRSIDVALRRRFELFECPADADVLARYYEDPEHTNTVSGLVDGFTSLNAELTERLDRHHTIGQSFFMDKTYGPVNLRRAEPSDHAVAGGLLLRPARRGRAALAGEVLACRLSRASSRSLRRSGRRYR